MPGCKIQDWLIPKLPKALTASKAILPHQVLIFQHIHLCLTPNAS